MIPRTLLTHGLNPMITYAKFLANLATQYGITITVKNINFANSNSQRRADLVTCRGGLVRPNPRFNFDQGTLLVMDFELGHTFDSSHPFKVNNLATMENQKRAKYHSDYHDHGFCSLVLQLAWQTWS